ncbi:hypothetical protein [uncultured Microbacterium sp.]|uniref:hypothetical protein n=1 Tax=uncultured Microbacterium sp. TaxID=191216 RepID=UPI002604E9E2|nr:hypothetical protein [uncultured Microbacterium sp.]
MVDGSNIDSPLAALRTTASHTIAVPHLVELLRVVPAGASLEEYRSAVVDENVLARPTLAGRQRSFRHLRELYLLDPRRRSFAALRRVWDVDVDAQPLLAGVFAVTRDEILRASYAAVVRTPIGAVVTSAALTEAVRMQIGDSLSDSTLNKTGRNTAACWTQTGHLIGRTNKVRAAVESRPVAIALAAYLGHLSGGRGVGVLESPSSLVLDLPSGRPLEVLRQAHAQGLLDLLVAGNVVDVSFSMLEGSL